MSVILTLKTVFMYIFANKKYPTYKLLFLFTVDHFLTFRVAMVM